MTTRFDRHCMKKKNAKFVLNKIKMSGTSGNLYSVSVLLILANSKFILLHYSISRNLDYLIEIVKWVACENNFVTGKLMIPIHKLFFRFVSIPFVGELL